MRRMGRPEEAAKFEARRDAIQKTTMSQGAVTNNK